MSISILNIIGYVGLIFGIVMSIKTGRDFARKKHDLDLFKKLGTHPVFSKLTYFSFLFIVLWNIFFMAMTKLMGFSFNVIISMFNVYNAVIGLLYTTVIMLVSFLVFKHKYKSINKPLTREGKLLCLSISKTEKLLKNRNLEC